MCKSETITDCLPVSKCALVREPDLWSDVIFFTAIKIRNEGFFEMFKNRVLSYSWIDTCMERSVFEIVIWCTPKGMEG